METIIVKVDTAERAAALLKYLKTLIGVKSVVREKHKSLTDADWVRPGRPATNKEIEQMLNECEKDGKEYSSDEVMKSVNERLSEWRKNKK